MFRSRFGVFFFLVCFGCCFERQHGFTPRCSYCLPCCYALAFCLVSLSLFCYRWDGAWRIHMVHRRDRRADIGGRWSANGVYKSGNAETHLFTNIALECNRYRTRTKSHRWKNVQGICYIQDNTVTSKKHNPPVLLDDSQSQLHSIKYIRRRHDSGLVRSRNKRPESWTGRWPSLLSANGRMDRRDSLGNIKRFLEGVVRSPLRTLSHQRQAQWR